MINTLLLYRHGVAAGIVSVAVLWAMQQFPIVWVFITLWVVWAALVTLLVYRRKVRHDDSLNALPLLLVTIVAFGGLMSLIEWQPLRRLLIVLAGFATALPLIVRVHAKFSPRYQLKPWRRMIMMLWVFDTYAIMPTLFGLGLFFPTVPFWIFALVGAALYGFVSLMIWRLYFTQEPQRYTLWVTLITLVMMQLIWTAHFLPYGHLALGLLVTWVWYVVQLFVRFHLGPKGIVWKKQKWFLAANAALYFFLLTFVIRWI